MTIGLVFRPIGETAKDTLVRLETLPEDQRAKVLAAWNARKVMHVARI